MAKTSATTPAELLAAVLTAQDMLRDYHRSVGDARTCTAEEAEALRMYVNSVVETKRAALRGGVKMADIIHAELAAKATR